MSDQSTRTAERQAQADPSPEAEARLLKERMRAGELNRERVELAARFGDAAALAVNPLTYEEIGLATHSLATWIAEWLPLAAALPDVERVVNIIFDVMSEAMCRGDRVEIRGFGAFSVKRRGARTGRNPKTGESVDVAETYFPAFRTGRKLAGRLNSET